MPKDLAIVLNNGGINSVVATALAAQRHRLVLLHAEAAPQAAPRARAAYDQQVAHFKPYREHPLAMPFLAAPTPAAPVPGAADPRQAFTLATQLTGLLPLMATAAHFAAHYGAVAVFVGLRVGQNADDLAQATEYLQIWNELLQLPCAKPELLFEAPLLELEPWQVVDVGFQAAAPYERAWSCAGDGPDPCWACPGCRAREAAFQQAAKPDPLRGVRRG